MGLRVLSGFYQGHHRLGYYKGCYKGSTKASKGVFKGYRQSSNTVHEVNVKGTFGLLQGSFRSAGYRKVSVWLLPVFKDTV